MSVDYFLMEGSAEGVPANAPTPPAPYLGPEAHTESVRTVPRRVHLASALRALEAAEARERRLGVVLDADETLSLAIDPLSLVCALRNLLHLTRKFAPGERAVILRTSTTDSHVCIDIEGHCEELESGDPARVSAFVQAAHEDGLSFCFTVASTMAEAMGGHLRVHPGVDSGFKFGVLLPLS
jgi:signal transduction histidine kinase